MRFSQYFVQSFVCGEEILRKDDTFILAKHGKRNIATHQIKWCKACFFMLLRNRNQPHLS